MIKQIMIARMSYYAANQDNIKLKNTFTKTLTCERVKMYYNCQHLFAELSPITHSLIIFLSENMDPFTNEIYTSKTTVRKYIEFRKLISLKPCSESAVRKAFQILRKRGILITTPEEANNIVNPKYLYKGSETERRLCVNKLLSQCIKTEWAKTNLKDALGVIIKH